MLGARKPWDQEARNRKVSTTWYFKAARPVEVCAVWVTMEAVEPGVPPCHLNCDQRLARSRFMFLANARLLSNGMFNSMYWALVLIRPSVGWVVLPVVLPEEVVASG